MDICSLAKNFKCTPKESIQLKTAMIMQEDLYETLVEIVLKVDADKNKLKLIGPDNQNLM